MVYCVFREVLLQYVKVEGIIPPGVSQIIHFFFNKTLYRPLVYNISVLRDPYNFFNRPIQKEQFLHTFERNIPLILITPFNKSRMRDENLVYLGSSNNRNRLYRYKYF